MIQPHKLFFYFKNTGPTAHGLTLYFVFLTSGKPISLMCDMVFTCGTIEVDTTDFKVKTDKIFIGEAATIQNVTPQKVNILIILFMRIM